jgi:uncharacterized integral membrane protein
MQDERRTRQFEEVDMRPDDDHGNDAPRGGWTERREGPSPKLIVAVAVLVLLLIFVLQNTDAVPVDFLFFEGDFPLWVVITGSALLGLIVGWSVGRVGRRRDGR